VLVSDFHVLTAGHIVYDHGGGCKDAPAQGLANISETTVSPAHDGELKPYDMAKVTQIRVHPGFENQVFKEVLPEQFTDDLALLTLDRSVGADVGAGSLSIFCDDTDGDDVADCTDDPNHAAFASPIRVVGYPEDVGQTGSMWITEGIGSGTDSPWLPGGTGMHRYSMGLSEKGMSGGPVLDDAGKVVSINSLGGAGWKGGPIDLQADDPHGVWFNDDRYTWMTAAIESDRTIHETNPEGNPPFDMPLPVFDNKRWSETANQAEVMLIGDRRLQSDTEYEISAGEETLQVQRNVRNVGPTANGEVEVEFRLHQIEGKPKSFEMVERNAVTAVETIEMPPPYESDTVSWTHTFSTDAIDKKYQAEIGLLGTRTDGELVTPDEHLETQGGPSKYKTPSSTTLFVKESESGGETSSLDLSATAEMRNGRAVIDVTLTNTGSQSVAGPTVQFLSEQTEEANTSYYSDDFEVAGHDDDGGDWFHEGWSWESIPSDASRTPSVTLDPADDLSLGTYTFALRTYVSGGGSVTIVDTATATITIGDGGSTGGGEPQIDGVDVDGGTFSPGEEVSTDVTVTNPADRERTIYVGYSAVDPSGEGHHNDGTTDEPVTLGPGETTTVTVTWTVESDVPSGTYDAVVALWKNRQNGDLTGRIEKRTVASAFEVQTGSGTVDARIDDLDVASGTFSAGEEVPTEVTMTNTGGVRHTFYVGYSAVDPSGEGHHNDGTTDEAVTLGPGETTTVTVTWTVESDVPSSTYDAVVALWKDRSDDGMVGRLAKRTVPDAFAVK